MCLGFSRWSVVKTLRGRQRRVVLHARLLVASGTVERDGEVVHLIAGRLEDHSRLLGELETTSRDFQ